MICSLFVSNMIDLMNHKMYDVSEYHSTLLIIWKVIILSTLIIICFFKNIKHYHC